MCVCAIAWVYGYGLENVCVYIRQRTPSEILRATVHFKRDASVQHPPFFPLAASSLESHLLQGLKTLQANDVSGISLTPCISRLHSPAARRPAAPGLGNFSLEQGLGLCLLSSKLILWDFLNATGKHPLPVLSGVIEALAGRFTRWESWEEV